MSEVENVETVATEAVAETAAEATRRANVSDEAIITAWQRIATEGEGSIQKVADEVGMLKSSLQTRLTGLRKVITLAEMPRAAGSGRKKSTKDLQALLAKINSDLNIE